VQVTFRVGRDAQPGQPVSFALTFAGGLLPEHELTLPVGTGWNCQRTNIFSNTVECTSAVRADRTLPDLRLITSTAWPRGTWTMVSDGHESTGTFGSVL